MESTAHRAIAIVGLGAVLPDAPDVKTFWNNIQQGRDSITQVPSDRWDPSLYYDADPAAPDKTYSKIGGWVKEFNWEPMKWHLPIPPKVSDAMDPAQRWGIACVRQALADYGFPGRPLDTDRTAVILGNAMAGERHYMTALRISFPEYAHALESVSSFAALPEEIRTRITEQLHDRMASRLPEITEDSMPGELANCIAGRIANLYNFHGPNFVVDAACASAMGAMSAAVHGLVEHHFDVAVTGGIDRNMGASTFVKFCKIGALSATGSRPYAAGADGFVMGEGAVVFLLKRLADAERDGDRVYAVLRGIGGSSDGKGKGITAPNPAGQMLCTKRAWEIAGLSPADANYIEGHGTSTRVGDVVEVQSMMNVLSEYSLPAHSIPLGSVKSNIGHLKAAAGAAGILKTVLALHNKVLPPSVHCEKPSPDIDFAHSPLFVNTELRQWDTPATEVRRAGVSAFGFGGTNFHTVLEEYVPGRLKAKQRNMTGVSEVPETPSAVVAAMAPRDGAKAPLRGILFVGANSEAELSERLRNATPQTTFAAPLERELRAPYRIAIDYGDAADLEQKRAAALKAIGSKQSAVWKALRAQGIFRGHGSAPKVAFLYTGQGSQYVNMFRTLRDAEPIVAETFREADRIMTPLLGKPLTDYIFADSKNETAVARAEEDLRQTAITQPAVLSVDIATTRLLAAYGIQPDMTMGHSLGEYGALVASGCLPFEEALEAVSARGREMTRVSVVDNGKMAAVFAPLTEIERLLKSVSGYVEIANINSEQQAVIGGASAAVEQACDKLAKAGFNVVPLPVSHAFHTSIVAPASGPLRTTLERMHLREPQIPIVANVNGEFYPNTVPQMLDILAQQIAAPVQFVKGLRTLYKAGARVFVEVGPKKALQGFAEDVLGKDPEVLSLFTNHPKWSDTAAFNQALCGLYAAGLGAGTQEASAHTESSTKYHSPSPDREEPLMPASTASEDRYSRIGRLFAEFLDRAAEMDIKTQVVAAPSEPVVITGAALGLPGTEHIFDDGNIARLLRGDQFIDAVPNRFRHAMVDRHIRRLVKRENGDPTFETIEDASEAIKLAGRGGAFDLEREFGVPGERVAAFDRTTSLALAAGIDALRDAGIPLVMRYKTTSVGTRLPDRWGLPECMRDDTGVIFASAFPGCDSLAEIMTDYHEDRLRREQLRQLKELRALVSSNGHGGPAIEIDRRISELEATLAQHPYAFERRFLLRVLPMGHSQLAEYVGARGPNTQINAACASTTQAVGLAEDWIRAGRCRRVLIVSADDVTSDNLLPWFGSGFLASGVAATDDSVEKAALPFDRRRHGMIIGMGAAALVVESAEAARERGMRPICEVLATVTNNSAFHATRLDVQHIGGVMDSLLNRAESTSGIRRDEIASRTVFVSHETYTPARGGSASAEISALRKVFGKHADELVIANTKGFTGHAMATGIEDVLAVKALETGIVPPVANFKEVDPELGRLNLSRGGSYPIEMALRLGAGFGSQISMSLLRWVPPNDGQRTVPTAFGYERRIADERVWSKWLERASGMQDSKLEIVNRTLRVADLTVGVNTRESSRTQPVAQQPVRAEVVEKPAAVEQAAPLPPEQKTDAVRERILRLVSEKTGYPSDMLALDLDLEADLGVDTVKQAEVFASIREEYNIPRSENLRLRDFPTLAHVIKFVYDNRPDLSAPIAVVEQPAVVAAPSATLSTSPTLVEAVQERILGLVVEKTGYPIEMLDMDLDLEADLGVDTVKQAELFAAIREIYNIPRQESLRLRDFPTLKHVVKFVYDMRPDLVAQATPVSASVVEPVHGEAAPLHEAAAPLMESRPETDGVTDRILDLVAEKTGYPKDMLDLELDLEADLGIDTVKQAEMFASIRSIYNIPRDENLKLRDFPTLKHVIQFARDRAGTLAAPKLAPESSPTPFAPPVLHLATFEDTDRIPRRVPVPVLRPPLNLCKNTGVSLKTGTRVIVMPDQGGCAVPLIAKLRALDVEVLTFNEPPSVDSLETDLQKWSAEGPIHGVYWLPALDVEAPLNELTPAEWSDAILLRLKLLYRTTRALYECFTAPGSFLVSATRCGGHHGYDEQGAVAPLGGAVAGFTKTFKRERGSALVKVVDFSSGEAPDSVAEKLIAETCFDPGAVEIGYKQSLRWTIALQEQSATDGLPGLHLGRDSVFMITGAAGSIVSAITADLAAASGGTFYLLDVVPEPDSASEDLKRFEADKDKLKLELAKRLSTGSKRATPAMVEKELAKLERLHAAQLAIDAVHAAGGVAHYRSVNLTDGAAITDVVEDVRRNHGRIDVLLHAAGLERSHFLPDKTPEEFDLVFDVKSQGFFHLMHAIGDMPLGAVVAFSSIAGRFGNAGQCDYSSANDLLCKVMSSFRTVRPNTRGIAIDWTAWAKIGMATRGSIPKMMELAGIDMLDPAAGIPLIRRELTMGGTRGEIVVAQRLGVLLEEFDPTGGLDLDALESSREQLPAAGPMLGKIVGMGIHSGLIMETTLDPASQPFLNDHRIDGTPVLPGVMGIEAFAETALCVHPGWHIEAIEEVQFLAPFKFYRNEPRTLTIEAVFRPEGGHIVTDCRLVGHRTLPGQDAPQTTTHFTARVRLRELPPASSIGMSPKLSADAIVESAQIYRVYFHGPAYQVLERAWWDGSHLIGEMAAELPANHRPSELPTQMAPRLIELCFQTAGLWEMGESSKLGLPTRVDQVVAWSASKKIPGHLYAVVTPHADQGTFDAEVLDANGNRYLRIDGYRTTALPVPVDADTLTSLQNLIHPEAIEVR